MPPYSGGFIFLFKLTENLPRKNHQKIPGGFANKIKDILIA